MAVSNKKKKQYTNDFVEWQNQNSGQLLAPLLAAAGKQAEQEAQKIPYADITPKLTKAEPTTSNSGGSALPSFSAMDMAKGLNHAVLGGVNQAEYGAKSGVSLAQQLLNAALGNEANVNMYANRQKQIAQEYVEQQQKLDDKYGAPTTGIGKFADQALSGAVGMAPLLPLYAVPGVGQALGTGAIFLSGGGMGQGNALMEGASVEDSLKYGALSGGIEAGTERLFGGIPLQKGLINAGGKVAAKVGKESLKPVIEKGVDLLGEGVEEGIVEALDPFAQRATYNPDAENASAKDIAYAAALGIATAAIMNGAAQVPKQLPKAVKNLPNAEKVQQNDQNRAFEALHGQKMGQNQTINAQNAQNGAGQVQANDMTNPIQTPNKVEQNQSSQADFMQNSVKNVQNQNTNDITPKLEDARQKITLEMKDRTFENVADKNVLAYQQEHPEIKPFQQETAEKLLYDLQMGEKGRREVGIDAETRNVTTMHGIKRNQSEPINRMLNDGLSYSKIEDGLNRIIEDEGSENTPNAKRVELYVHDAMRDGYNSITSGRVSPNRTVEYLNMSLEEKQAEFDRLGDSFTEDEVWNQELIEQMQELDRMMRTSNMIDDATGYSEALGKKRDKSKKYGFDSYDEVGVAESATTRNNGAVAEESSTVESEPDSINNYAEFASERLKPEVREFIGTVGQKLNADVIVMDGLPKGANGMFTDGKVYLNGKNINSIESVRAVTAHEVYHAMKNTDEFRNLQDVAMEFYRTLNPRLTNDDWVQMKIKEYGDKGVPLSVDAAYDELTADFMEVALFDAKVAERIWTEHPTLAQRIKWFIDDLLFEFRNRKLSDLEYKQAALLYNAQQMYAEGLQSMKYNGQTTGESRYMFAGENSLTADREALARAKQMEAEGADMESIRQATGWFKSKVTGGKWAYEIDDSKADYTFMGDLNRLKNDPEYAEYMQMENNLSSLDFDANPELEKRYEYLFRKYAGTGRNNRGKASDFVSHDALFEAYPQLAEMNWYQKDMKGTNGSYTPRVEALDMNGFVQINKSAKDPVKTSLHEMQHAIQEIEGFPGGSSAEYWGGNLDAYQNTAGEIMARDTKKRRNLDNEQRMKKQPEMGNKNTVYADGGSSYSLSDLDSEYMDAVNHGDMEAAQRMVDEAAKAAGYSERLYHQTGAVFSEFDTENQKAGKYDYIMPTGIFLKPDDGDIGLRGKLQMELYAKIQKPLEFRDRIEMQNYWFKRLPNYEKLSRQVDENDVEYKKRIDIAMDRIRQARQDFFDGKITEEDRSRIREESKAETDRLFAEWSEANNELALQMKGMIDEYMKSSDYDGVIVENDEGSFGRSTKAYIVFDSSQLKSADAKTYDNEGNIVPLSQRFDAGNADIRYSLPKDTSGRQLTAEQADYFKNSKVRDDNGNLKVVYHGSPSKFYEFDWAKVGTNGTQEGKGFYFTDNEDIAWEYVNSTDGGARAFYLNIKNPLSGLEVTLSKAKVKRLLKESDKFVQQVFDDDYFLDNWGDTAYYGKDKVLNEAVDGLFKYNQSDADILYDIMNTAGIYNNADVQSYMEFITDKFGYDGIITEWLNWETGGGDTIYVAFNSNSAKLTSNQNPTDSKDIRYSMGNSRYQDMIDQYGSIEPGENPTGNNRDVKVPKQTSDFDKTRKFTRTAMEAEQVDDVTTGMIADDLTADMQSGRFVYEPTSNQKQVDRANSLINQTGWEQQAENFRAKYRSGESMSADDIALGERLIQEAQKAGDYQMAVDLIADVAAIGTEAGRSVQALKILKRLTPEGQLMALKRIEQRINSSLAAQQKPPVALPESIAEEMLQARGSEKQAEIWDKAIKELANQVPATFADKVNAWRYLAMLSNPKTHIRNMVGNATMRAVMGVKNIVQTGIETTLSPFGIERTAAIKVPKEYRDFAKWDFENNAKKMLEAGGGRYNDEIGLVSQNKQIFKNPVLETARKKNTELLEAEDMLFKKAAYIDAMARYMKANGLSPSVLQNKSAGNNATYEKAQNYAVEQARKATFQEASKLAQKLSEIENMSATGKVMVGALVPFKKTPINILKRGVEYSPVGIINGVKKAVFDVKKGDATPAEVIDAMSAGLTGTGIMMVGYFLASMGLLSAGADDDDQRKARYDSQMGNQNYALVLPDGSTYTIDWLAPSVMPMMVGAELYKQLSGEQADSNNATGFTKAIEALTRVGNPLLEMSMLQGLTDALQSYNSGTGQFLSDFAISAGTGYAGQFIPAPVSAMARTLDDTVRSSYAPKDSPLMKEGETFLRQQANKLPVVSQQMQPSIDLWGNERKREGDTIAERAFHNFINPGTYSSNKRTALDNKLDKLYEATGDSNVLPKSADSYVKYDGQTYYKSPFEKTRYDTTKGQKSKQYVTDFINSSAYRTLDDTTKAGIVKEMYDLADYQAKKEMLIHRGIRNYSDSDYEKVLESGVAPGKYYAAKEALSNFTGDGSKDKKIAYLQNMKNSGEITDRQFWYMRKAIIGKFNQSEMAACPYADIKNM